jgi:4-hydroxybenzoate polyprenyltransferase
VRRLTFVVAMARICRAEYIKGELPAVFIPALLCATSFGTLISWNVIESILIFSVLYVTGFMINSVADREIDLRYNTFKRQIGSAAGELGERKVLAMIAVQVAIGLALTIDLAVRLGNLWLVPLALGGLFLGLAYSARPFSFKTRGVVPHAVSLSLSAFTVPFLFLYIAARGSLDFPGVLLVGSFTVAAYSLEYVNQAYDFTEDLRAGVATPAVRMGLRRSLRFAFAVCAVSLPLLAFSLAYFALSRPTVVLAAGDAARPLIALGAVAAVVAGYFIPLRGMARIASAAKEADADSEEVVATVHRECNYSLWQASGVTGLASFALAVFFVSSSMTVALAGEAEAGFRFDGSTAAEGSLSAGIPFAEVDGNVLGLEEAPRIPSAALVRLEIYANSEPVPYRVAILPVTLPEAGASSPFHFGPVPLRIGALSTAHLTLLVDATLSGSADTPAATMRLAIA